MPITHAGKSIPRDIATVDVIQSVLLFVPTDSFPNLFSSVDLRALSVVSFSMLIVTTSLSLIVVSKVVLLRSFPIFLEFVVSKEEVVVLFSQKKKEILFI